MPKLQLSARYIIDVLSRFKTEERWSSGIDLSLIPRPAALMNALLLQAVYLYGGSTNDYKLVYGPHGSRSDFEFANLEIANGFCCDSQITFSP